ncbi:MAG: acyl-CoA dehydrogenase family protein [Actinobacteria bacterium]|nr:acyl-CoA dehydrogenase family protein [Actinomycetota bacterium]
MAVEPQAPPHVVRTGDATAPDAPPHVVHRPAPGTTHEVTNQPPPLEGYDVYAADRVLVEAVEREGAGWAGADLHRLGRRAGSAEAVALGFAADVHRPALRTHDRYGHRVDEVDFHPSYHELLGTSVRQGLHAAPWAAPRPGTHVARAAGFVVWSQVDAGTGCPASMTYASLPVLRAAPGLFAGWGPRLVSRHYSPAHVPHPDKGGAQAGMAMTEKQGGSDVRAGTTRAVRTPAADHDGAEAYRLTGHKWFCSAPMSDAFLVLAQTPGGLTCFLLPRVLPDGTRNAVRLQRLKDKLGNRSNASAEIELVDTLAWRVGEEGRGVRTIVEMVALTRLDCVLGTAALMRQAVAQATHHAAHRSAFGRRLADAPLMQAVLADLAVESEAATVLGLRLAGAVDRTERDPDDHEQALRRIGTAVAKYYVCKRGSAVTAEALECLGGNGYVEESVMPRLYREAPVNSVWEGSGNVNALDVLRALARTPAVADAVLREIDLAAGADTRLDAAAASLRRDLGALVASPDAVTSSAVERGARRLVERTALALQGSLLVRHSPAAVADAFCGSRFGDGGLTFGTQPDGADLAAIVARHTPALP